MWYLYGVMTSEQELKLGVYLAGEILPNHPITVTDPQTGIVGRFVFQLEMVDDELSASGGYVPISEENIQVGGDGVQTVSVTIQISPQAFMRMPQTGAPWSKLLIFLGPRLKQPMADMFPDESTRNSEMWIISEVHKALEQIGALQEVLLHKDAMERSAKIFQAQGFKVNPVFFSHFRFEQGLGDGRLTGEYQFLGPTGGGEIGGMTERDLQSLLAQNDGLKQWEIVRPDEEGGKVEYGLITGWKSGAVLLMPRREALPAWAERAMANIGQIFTHRDFAEINFTAEERAAFSTADFISKKFQPAYVLAVKAAGEHIDAAFISRRNNLPVPDSLVRIKWDGTRAATQENYVARMVQAARWSLSRVPTIHPEEVVKAGVCLEDVEQLGFLSAVTVAKEFKAAVETDGVRRMAGAETAELANIS